MLLFCVINIAINKCQGDSLRFLKKKPNRQWPNKQLLELLKTNYLY